MLCSDSDSDSMAAWLEARHVGDIDAVITARVWLPGSQPPRSAQGGIPQLGQSLELGVWRDAPDVR